MRKCKVCDLSPEKCKKECEKNEGVPLTKYLKEGDCAFKDKEIKDENRDREQSSYLR